MIILLPVFLLSLIAPIVMVINWQSRPVWSLLTASGLYLLPIFFFLIYSIVGGYQRATGMTLVVISVIFMIAWLLAGLVFLVPIQWKSRKAWKKRNMPKPQDVF